MGRAHRRGRITRYVLIAVGLYLGLTLLVALLYALRSCLGAQAELHCSMGNTVVWGKHKVFGFLVLAYVIVLCGLWVKRR